jgi:hypothetical protein
MTSDEAIDAALLAFMQQADSHDLRTRIAAAVSAHDSALRTCRACHGSGRLRVRGARIYVDEGFRAAQNPVADGDDVDCVACGGQGVDVDQVAWLCTAVRHPACGPDHHGQAGHDACGWARPVSRSDESTSSG